MIGARLKSLRQEHKITQKQLAEKLNISPSTIAMYESNRRDPDTEILKKLSNIFSVSSDYLLGKTSHPLTQEFIDKSYTKIKKTFGEDAEVMFHDISQFDQEDFEKLQLLVNMVKNQKK